MRMMRMLLVACALPLGYVVGMTLLPTHATHTNTHTVRIEYVPIHIHDAPLCPEDEVIIGVGNFDAGQWERYVCGPSWDTVRMLRDIMRIRTHYTHMHIP